MSNRVHEGRVVGLKEGGWSDMVDHEWTMVAMKLSVYKVSYIQKMYDSEIKVLTILLVINFRGCLPNYLER